MNQDNSSFKLPSKTVLIAFILAIMLGGGNAVAIRFAVRELAPFWGAALRFGGGAIILWFVAAIRRSKLPPRSVLPGLLVYGFLSFGAAWAFIFWGLRTVEAGMAQVLMALSPLLTLVFVVLHRQESFHWRGLAGGLMAIAGVGWAFFEHPQGSTAVLPMLAIVAGAACLSESIVLLKRLPPMDPIMINAAGMSTGAASLLILSRIAGEAWKVPSLAATRFAILYLVIVGSVIFFGLLFFVVRRWTASASSYGLVLMPFETVALSAWLTGEKLNSALLLGGALVLLGVWIGALARPARSRRSEAAIAVGGEAD